MEHSLEQTLPAPSTAPPPSIQACPALRAARIDPRVSPRVAPRQKKPQDRTQTAPKPVFPENQIISELPTRAPAQARQQLFADGKHAEITGPLAKACPKMRLATSSPARKSRMWYTTYWPSWRRGC